jgi:hypothetical protein
LFSEPETTENYRKSSDNRHGRDGQISIWLAMEVLDVTNPFRGVKGKTEKIEMQGKWFGY